ncbi:hypothetical protein BTVI_77309 [Pitangus sulphuratus]|nr:hypothetical protein BTVI_77309 [Pitangus sulphuratus]
MASMMNHSTTFPGMESSGISPDCHDLSKTMESGLKMKPTNSLSTHGCIPSGPMDLQMSSLTKLSLPNPPQTGKTQVMGEIKIALKKEMKTDGEQLIVEILQCRNITYKFKSPDHLPDLYVKLYVVNISTQKRVIKKKTRVCRHDREPSFNETFRFSLSPAGHSLQFFNFFKSHGT